MVAHQAVGVTQPSIAPQNIAQDIQKGDTIRIIRKDGVLPVTPRRQIQGTRKLDAQRSGPTASLKREGPRLCRGGSNSLTYTGVHRRNSGS